ncbi:NAD-dependent epimerase/dehydratase family protein [Xenorhabdus griffiniae]|uniref:NAD-dependent epimerase/dehydratase family protein n=1 Tax=Xenorhabdus griffiniae TaxID=351672 RepID=UPI0023588929|nr:SDR family oxidoreductase [Xenorhabdus griffiniae]MDC9603959.1 SDR family oxidoreductase [Xenorhabdus griffiniae]
MGMFTIFGGRGFIGSKIVEILSQQGHKVWIPLRDDNSIFEKPLGTVIYCAGNGNCQDTPFSVLEANTCLLAKILEKSQFNQLLYMSSTRVYMNNENSNENSELKVCIDDNRRLFNLTKLVAEELCLKSGRDICIVRPSNVYGLAINSPLFLPSITRSAIEHRKIDMYIKRDYAKDYVSVTDVANACIYLSKKKEAAGKVINIATGYNIKAEKIADTLQKNTQCKVIWHQIEFPNENFPITDISLLKKLMPSYSPRNVIDDIEEMIHSFRIELSIIQ